MSVAARPRLILFPLFWPLCLVAVYVTLLIHVDPLSDGRTAANPRPFPAAGSPRDFRLFPPALPRRPPPRLFFLFFHTLRIFFHFSIFFFHALRAAHFSLPLAVTSEGESPGVCRGWLATAEAHSTFCHFLSSLDRTPDPPRFTCQEIIGRGTPIAVPMCRTIKKKKIQKIYIPKKNNRRP